MLSLQRLTLGIRVAFLFLVLGMGFPGQTAYAQFDEAYLEPEKAFGLSAKMADPKTAAVTYEIASGYYMYRERFQFSATSTVLGVPKLPSGKVKFDETFQKEVETYRDAVTIFVPVQGTDAFTLTVVAQGCADQGLCYAPMTSQIRLSPDSATPAVISLDGVGSSQPMLLSPQTVVNIEGGTSASNQTGNQTGNQVGNRINSSTVTGIGANPESSRIGMALKSGKLITILPLFFLLGLGLAFTPCVLPMVPILSSIIIGEGKVSRRRGFFLALTYSLGMALVYTALGLAAGLIGEGLAAYLQTPVVLGAFALMMVGFSLSMFGLYDLRMPGFIQARITRASQNRRAGKTLGVFVMGALSALIVGPCVVAPLAGALVYVSQTRDVVIGGSALFALAMGMSVPLLLVGLSAGALLPRAGAWMNSIQRFFGVLMLSVALWMVSPLLPISVQMAGWAALGIGYGAFLLWSTPVGWRARALGIAMLTLGLTQLVGVASGATDMFRPLTHLYGASQPPLAFQRIKSVAQLDGLLASNSGKTVLLDFYADWCVACKEMEKLTFVDPGIRQQLAGTILLQADVTANNAEDRALLKRFQLFGPPGIILFDTRGREIPDSRIIGYQGPQQFSRSIAVLKAF